MIYIVLTTLVILELLIVILASSGLMITVFFITDKITIYYDNWKAKKWRRKAEKDYEEYLQRKHRRELRRKEKERYPLFYLKEGIV